MPRQATKVRLLTSEKSLIGRAWGEMNQGWLKDARVQIVLLSMLALAARLVFLQVSGWAGQIINGDAHEYLAIADSLRQGLGYAFADGTATAFRPFGYPVLLAGIRAVAGEHVATIQIFQAIVGAALVAPTFGVARRYWSGPVAGLAGLGVALHPVLIYLTAVISPDLVSLLAAMIVLWSAQGLASDWSPRTLYLATGVVAGFVACIMRPEMLLLLWLLPILLALQVGLRGAGSKSVMAMALLATAFVVIPTTIRNFQRFGEFMPMPTIGGVTFWGANNAKASGGWILPTADNWPEDDPPLSMRGWENLSESESQDRFYEASWRWLANEPGAALALVPSKLYRSWTISYADEQRAGMGTNLLFLLNVAFGLLVVGGAVMVVRKYRQTMWLFAAPIFAWLAKTVVFYGSARQTAAVLPVLIILAALFVTALWHQLVRRGGWRGRSGRVADPR